jgi:RNA polymerase sigma-70 factor (ECF subfamily)
LKQAEQYTEAQLVSLLQARKQEAFAYLYDHYSGALNAIIYAVVGDATVAEDVLQEVFIRIFRKI